MSGDSRPSPVQPPLDNSYADTMAQVRHPPNLPTLKNFTGYPDHGSTPGFSSPPFRPSPAQDQAKASVRLPPMRTSPDEPIDQRSSQALSINSLLSGNDERPKQSSVPQLARPHHPLSRLPTDSPASSYENSPGRPGPHWTPTSSQSYSSSAAPAPRPIAPAHFLDHPPPDQRPQAFARYSHEYHHKQVQSPRHPYPGPIRTEQGYLPMQPDPRTHSRSHYTSSSEPSPSAISAPFHIPQRQLVPPPPLDYNLSIRQQPAAARACGFGERDRRVVDPPPILELKITDKATGKLAQDNACILAMHCALLNHDGSDESDITPAQDGMPSTRRLMGTIVASPYQAKDENGVAGTFFVFPDLSCRSPGKYKLGFKLLRVDIMSMGPGTISPSVASATSDTFSVYTAKDFPGMRASSGLLKALRRQGLNVGVKKGSEARKGKAKSKKEESEDDDDSEGDEEDEGRGSQASNDGDSSRDVSPKTAARKKGKRRRVAAR